MRKHLHTVETLTKFSEVVEQTANLWAREGMESRLWFRGQKRSVWKLSPTAFRRGTFSRDNEDRMRQEFVLRSPALLQGESIPQDDWSSYFMMQHYGAPTRLLDWTESPLLALYFALKENYGYYDAAVWMLAPSALNEVTIKSPDIVAPNAPGIDDDAKKLIEPWLTHRFKCEPDLPELPVAIFPMHFARRISSQRSCFSIHGYSPKGFDSFLTNENCLGKMIIPARAVQQVRKSLALQGIDETMIFPDLAGLCKALEEKWYAGTPRMPHDGTFVRLRPSGVKPGDVGIFAIAAITKDQKVFDGENEEVVWTSKGAIPQSGNIRDLYDDFAIIKNDIYGTPTSFNRITPAWFIQDSKSPNLRCDEDYDFYAIRDIREDEELTVDYSSFSDGP